MPGSLSCDFSSAKNKQIPELKTRIYETHVLVPDATHLLAFSVSIAIRLLANCFSGSPVFSHNCILGGGGDGSQSSLFC